MEGNTTNPGKPREGFGSKFGALMALVGMSIGLGNIWRFPYMVGVHGGAAFILVYMVIFFLICLPVLNTEITLGRMGQANPFGTFKRLAPGTGWKWGGALMVFTPTIVLSYYCVIGGWALGYLFKAFCFSFTSAASESHISTIYAAFVSSPWQPLLCQTVFLLLTGLVIIAGVKNGIERLSKIMMPLLFVIILLVLIRSVTLPGAGEGLKYLFKPDFSKITPKVCLAALGQGLFSVSVGHGMMLTAGSYVSKGSNIGRTCTLTGVSDFVFAIMASCAIMPAVFAFGLSPSSGAGLVFETLPYIFSKMPLGGVVAILFFLGVLVAAITSSVCMFEVPEAFLTEERHMGRGKAAVIVFAVAWVIGGLCALSFGPLSGLKILGQNFFNFCDQFCSNFLIVIGAFLVVVFVGWKLDRGAVRSEFLNGGAIAGWYTGLYGYVRFIIRYIAPIAVLAILVSGFLV